MKKSFQSSTKNTLISGRNTYRDTHGNLIYYDQHKNIAYRIPSTKENTFATFQSRYALALICFVFLYILFSLNVWLSIGISVAVAAFMEWRYRTFLKNLAQSTGFIKKEKIIFGTFWVIFDLKKKSACFYLYLPTSRNE